MNDKILNIYGDPATHRDCTHYYEGKCSGEMVWWTNPNTDNSMTMCAHHAQKADDRQYKIKAEYLHDGIHDEEY